MAETRNLGLVKAIHIGTEPPVNTFMLWYDNNDGVKYHKYYDVYTETWLSLAGAFVQDIYRLGSFSVNGETDVVFSSALSISDYYITIKEFIATDGTNVKSGWSVANKLDSGFTFTPPLRYLTGIIVYEAKLYK